MPVMRYGHIADFITIGSNSKPILVGIFDRILAQSEQRPIALPLSYLFAVLQCSIGEGATHDVVIQLRDGNSEPVGDPQPFGPLAFVPTGPGYPLQAYVLLCLLGGAVPDVGDYDFEVRVDGVRVGEVSFVVVAVPPPPPQPQAQ